MPAWSGSGEPAEASSWLADDCLLAVSSHGKERVSEHCGVSYKETNTVGSEPYLHLPPPPGCHLTLITSIKALCPNTVTLEVETLAYELGEGANEFIADNLDHCFLDFLHFLCEVT